MEDSLSSNQSRALLGLNPSRVKDSVDPWEIIPAQLVLEKQAWNASYKMHHLVNKLLNSYSEHAVEI